MADRFQLTAGPLTMEYADGDIRALRCGSVEIINRIYFALRDQNWGTVAGKISRFSIDQNNDGFLLTYHSDHRQGDIAFEWDAEIRGENRGRVSFRASGVCLSSFIRNRIGFCVLNPISAAGNRVRVAHPDGTATEGVFPRLISPFQPFKDIAAIRHYTPDGIEALVTFSGETFEMEDQRNWTDGTYKTYCTPLSLPFPVEVKAGDRIEQAVVIDIETAEQVAFSSPRVEAVPAARDTPAILTVDLENSQNGSRLPELGLGYGRRIEPLSRSTREKLLAVKPAFLNVELLPSSEQWKACLAAASVDSRATGIPLAVTLRLSDDAASEVEAVRKAFENEPPEVCCWTVLSEHSPTTMKEHLTLVRKTLLHIGNGAPIGGGTRAFFAELNRNRPALDKLDYVSYTINPQVHAFDNRSIVETIDGQRSSVESASALCGGKPVHVGSVTLRPQWNPNATAPETEAAPDKLPPEVDPRQRSAFTAAWTLGSIKALGESGAAAATFYEIEGWKGILESPEGSSLPTEFPSHPGELFPVYHALRALASMGGREVRAVRTTRPQSIDALAIQVNQQVRLIVMNYLDEVQSVFVHGVPALTLVEMIVVNAPGSGGRRAVRHVGNDYSFELGPHEIGLFDCIPR